MPEDSMETVMDTRVPHITHAYMHTYNNLAHVYTHKSIKPSPRHTHNTHVLHIVLNTMIRDWGRENARMVESEAKKKSLTSTPYDIFMTLFYDFI